jgi:hypothetical protein
MQDELFNALLLPIVVESLRCPSEHSDDLIAHEEERVLHRD